MRDSRHTIRLIHRWLMLAVGLQFVVWVTSGMYFALLDIHYIHGESQSTNEDPPIAFHQVRVDFPDIQQHYPGAMDIRLGQYLSDPVYRFSMGSQRWMVNATTAKSFAPMTETEARELAQFHYRGTALSQQAVRFDDNAPEELSTRHLPVWQVTFDDALSTTFYLSVTQRELVTIRHTPWRAFDWFWRFHIMDYSQGSDTQNRWLFWITLMGIISGIMGLCLTWFRFTSHREPA